MVAKYCPHIQGIAANFGNPNNSGEAHKMAMWIGAAMDERSSSDVWPGQTFTGKNLRPNLPFYKAFMDWFWGPAVATLPMLYVGATGRRCMNEQLQFVQAGHAILSQPGGFIWSVWDSAWQDKLAYYPEMTPGSLNTAEQVELDVKEGLTVRADTIAELVDKTGVDPETFTATLERYHEACARSYDSDCLKDPMWLTTIDTAPVYASKIGTVSECTRGGLKVNDRMQVLDKQGYPIRGLYATGNNAGSFYGSSYPTTIVGSGVGHGMCFGYLAAIDALSGDR